MALEEGAGSQQHARAEVCSVQHIIQQAAPFPLTQATNEETGTCAARRTVFVCTSQWGLPGVPRHANVQACGTFCPMQRLKAQWLDTHQVQEADLRGQNQFRMPEQPLSGLALAQ